MSFMKPLPPDATPDLKKEWSIFTRILGFVPNSLLTMQRRPKMVKGFGELTKGVMDPDGPVDLGLMRLIAHFASRAAGCQYCEAHSLIAARNHDMPQEKLDAIWEYQQSPLYTEAERVALDFALAAGSVPNAVDADLFAKMREHWTEEQIVQILGAVCLYGFLNRWNDTMATDLEESPRELGNDILAKGGWTGGKHV